MQLAGSCHCGRVQFTLNSPHLYPYNLCYCSICCKTAGGGGYAINLSGEDNIHIYSARITDSDTQEESISSGQRHFCSHCGSALWLWDPRWPELVHPFASAIDTELPIPPEHTHLMLASKARWVELNIKTSDQQFDYYPQESIAQWHQRLGLEC